MTDFEKTHEYISNMLYQVRREGEWRTEENVKQSIAWGEKLIETLRLIKNGSISPESAAQELEESTKNKEWTKDCLNSLERILEMVKKIKLRKTEIDDISFDFWEYYVSYC